MPLVGTTRTAGRSSTTTEQPAAVRSRAPGSDRQQEDSVQISVNRWLGKGNAEHAGEERPSGQQGDADEPVIDG